MNDGLLKPFWYVREYLFPSGCAICGTPLLSADEAFYGLCGPCRAGLRVNNGARCRRCGRPLISEAERCIPCRNEGGQNCDGVIALFPYAGKYQTLLARYKFGASRPLGNYFAEALREALPLLFPEGRNGLVWTPVPPRPGKLRLSGWDQVEYLARLLERQHRAGHGALPVKRSLKRLASASQKTLNREQRRINLRGKLLCRAAAREVVLFDDVITTGSTIEACAAALKDAGAETVHAVCLFYD